MSSAAAAGDPAAGRGATSLDVDFNGDGKPDIAVAAFGWRNPDIVVGNFSVEKPIAAWVDVWMNRGRKAKQSVQ